MTFTWVLVAVLLTITFVWHRKSTAPARYLPPGPRPVPILGNVLDLTAKELWLVATKWAAQFGDVVHVHIMGQRLIFLSSPEATMELLDRKGSIYSDKPPFVMAGELCGCDDMVAFTRYGDKSKRQRRLLNQAFGVQVIPSYHPLIQSETHSFIRRLVADPSKYMDHLRRYAGGLTLSVVYGYEASPNNDKFLTLGEESVDILANKITSGGGIWPVDIFPSLKHLPRWAPGSSFLTKADVWKAKMEEFVDQPYNFVKASLKSGSYAPSFCSTLLEGERECTEQFEVDLKNTANSMYGASMDTIITSFCHFLLAMMLHPEILEKAQKELDSVLGPDRLPTFSDRPSLPFIDAVVSEVYRWGVVLPMSLPHRLMEDDVYRGMFIPKGSLVFANVWAITRDETLFPNASAFLPERYLEKVDPALAKRRDPRNYVFGFGRRRCPGVHLAESSVWLLVATVLATLDISKAKDDFGHPIEPKIEFNNAIFRTPDRFECNIHPRSEHSLKLVRETEGARA
ncbi:cytochrome P450 [Mycena rosella]|uniref:Cytochrome P450 n=1 Tax=Mycena rosella TaxID=1033263 RepID=A0AAD7CNP4_MYCRO|nr:cytochrome P450 [Mycena rosella]